MTSKPCKSLKKDGAPCRGSGFDQLDGYCIANAPAPSCPPPPVCHHAPKLFPNLSQTLVNSRHLSVDISKNWTKRRLYRLPAARIRLPFARCPCTKPAICAGAVNHPHHTNQVNHSSDKCQPALVHALIPVNPFNRRQRASSPTRTRAAPHARPSPASRLPSCAQNFFTQSLVNSRLSLVHLSVPLTFQRIGQRGDSYRLPAARIRLPFARCPCTKPAICAVAVNHPHHTKSRKSQFRQMSTSPRTCAHTCQPLHPPRAAFASHPSAVMRPKLFHPISRELSSISRPSLGYR